MTVDVLIIALAALITSNLVLLVAASRSGKAGQGDRGGEPSTRTLSAAESRGLSVARMIGPAPVGPVPVVAPRVVEPPVAVEPPESPDPAPAAGSARPAAPATPESDVPPVRSEPDSPAAPAIPEPSSAAPSGTSATPARRPPVRRGGGPKRGRRFTLPSIEVDHARTERVVLSLLTGDDEMASAPEVADPGGGPMVDAWERLVGSGGTGEAARAAVVVALTLDGLDRLTEVGGRDVADRAVGSALDAIRRSARASDRVASVGRGHFRVLLVDADDAVAARFVGRVRETLERRPSLAATSVALAAGWAEAHTAGHLEGAVHAAEDRRRSDAAPSSRRSGDSSPA